MVLLDGLRSAYSALRRLGLFQIAVLATVETANKIIGLELLILFDVYADRGEGL